MRVVNYLYEDRDNVWRILITGILQHFLRGEARGKIFDTLDPSTLLFGHCLKIYIGHDSRTFGLVQRERFI